jgi:hypothetical protein
MEVTLDYGSRSNEDWLLYYGFLPRRNAVESITLPDSKRVATWNDVRTSDVSLQRKCRAFLEGAVTSLEEDLELLHRDDSNDFRLETAVQYRINRKSLLSAVGRPQMSALFSSLAETAEIKRREQVAE